MPLTLLVRSLRDQKRQGYLDDKLVRDLYGIFWGTYSFAQDCNGQVLVTMHLEGKDGSTYNFQGQGLPQSVMQNIAGQVFEYFQKTKFLPKSLWAAASWSWWEPRAHPLPTRPTLPLPSAPAKSSMRACRP